MQPLGVVAGMKKKPGQKNGSFLTGMNSVSGILKINGLNSGIFSMEEKRMGEHFRVFPISNWTEMDIWQYIHHENIDLPSIYYTRMNVKFLTVMAFGSPGHLL
jgi:3'-phosphoadenosine 5'-phosphosulfate sulfotransferase (PAPS reductase)/FAD synthetase